MDALMIGAAARQSGVGVETIRFYERRGLIRQPAKLPGVGRRRYAPEIVERIRFIRQAQKLGFSLRQIEELLSLEANPAADCSDVRLRALAKIEEVEGRIGQLAAIRGALVRLLAACPGSGALGACSILGALHIPAPAKSSEPAPPKRSAKKRGTMKTAILRIDGMHCEGCAQTIQALVGAEPGVEKVVVSFKDGEAHVVFDSQQVGDAAITAAIVRAGFKVASRQ